MMISSIETTNSIPSWQHVADHKTKYKWLAGGVEFVDNIPKNASGKLLRRVLRDQVRARAQAKL